MKPLTKIAAWVWLAMVPLGLIFVVYQYLRPPAAEGAHPSAHLAVSLEMAALAVVCGVALLRRRAWAWWVAVVWLALGAVGAFRFPGAVVAGEYAAWPQWLVAWTLAAYVIRLALWFVLLADPPARWGAVPPGPTVSSP
jgi:hypothetical protein